MKNQSALARDMATYRELDRDEAALGWVAIAAAGFLSSSFVLFRTDLAHSPTPGRASLDNVDSARPLQKPPSLKCFCQSKENLMPDSISVSQLSCTVYYSADPIRPWKPENR